MRWLGWFALCTAALAGCQGNPPRFDPFLGPATVPPPSTGGATLLPPGDPYAPQPAPLAPTAPPYTPPAAAPPYSPAPPAAAPAPAPMPGAATPYAPPGGFQYRQSSLPTPPPGEGRLVPLSSTAQANAAPASAAMAETTGQRAIEQVDFETPQPASQQRAAASEPPPDRFGHDPSYTRLRGQLDYSAIDKSWRLRYIPLSSDMDDYGGSVRLREHPSLADREPGEFVEIDGAIDQQDRPAEGYAPWFRISTLTVQR